MLRVVVVLMTKGSVGGPEAEGYVHYSQEGFKEGFLQPGFQLARHQAANHYSGASAKAKGEHAEGGADGMRQG